MPKPRLGLSTFLVAVLSTILFLSLRGSLQSTSEISNGSKSPNSIASAEHLSRREENRVALSFGRQSSHQLSKQASKVDERQAALAERAFPDTLTYTKALCNGRRYWALIQSGNPNPPTVTQKEFDESGWSLNEGYPKVIDDDLRGPVAQLGISTDPADLYRVAAQQFSPFTNQNGQPQDDPSGGQYLQVYIPKSGTIIAAENISPMQNIIAYYRDSGLPPRTPAQMRDLIPPLGRWSDIAWFVWAQKAAASGQAAGGLRYIIRDNIINNDTKGVIDQVFKIPSYSFDLPWPGKTFDVASSDDGKALLGTPHGSGIAWMMADNRGVLGPRGLKVTCFTSDGFFTPGTQYFMLFELTRGG
ncbi:MAG: hypothetical protein LQ350_005178 [Teloschistes chrysophthalmus]|nr:MAG: hypothetical protein LQ350_005178 [Niorma chrysophthalma]